MFADTKMVLFAGRCFEVWLFELFRLFWSNAVSRWNFDFQAKVNRIAVSANFLLSEFFMR